MEITLVGHVCIDQNISEDASYTSWGSSLCYMAHYFQKQWSIKPVLVAPYGHDFHKYAEGLNLLSPPQGKHTLVYKNHTKQGYRTQQCEHVDAAEPVGLDEKVKRQIARSDIICVAPLLPNISVDYVRELLAFRKLSSLSVLLPQGYLRRLDAAGHVSPREFAEADVLIPLFDMVILSEDDYPDALGLTQSWAQKAPRTQIIVTQGSKGASWVTSSGTVAIETEPVPDDKIVDSVGCGDVFSAAAMQNYLLSRDLTMAARAGNQAARAKLFHIGV